MILPYPYPAQIWLFEGRECDTRSENDILNSIRTLAPDPSKNIMLASCGKWIMTGKQILQEEYILTYNQGNA